MAYASMELVELYRVMARDVAELRAGQATLLQRIEGDQHGVATGTQAALIHAVYAVTAGERFSSQGLLDLAHRPGEPERALRSLLGADRLRSAAAIGKALSGAAGRPCVATGMVLQNESRAGRGAWWLVSNPRIAAER